MNSGFSRNEALELLLKHNKQTFHLYHALTLEAVMGWFASQEGFDDDRQFWSIAGLLHDIDFEEFPDEHCVKAAEILKSAGASDELIRAVCCHAYGICSDIKPIHKMEKILFAVDELTGLIGAAAKMRPSKSCTDMEVSSLKKKFKDKAFAAGCSRDVIRRGAEILGWELDELFRKTLAAMAATEESVQKELELITK